MAAQQISLHSSRLDAPAVSTLIHHAGVQHDPVLAGRRHGTAVRFADLADGGNFIGTGAQLSGQGKKIHSAVNRADNDLEQHGYLKSLPAKERTETAPPISIL